MSEPFHKLNMPHEFRRLRNEDASAMHELESICFSMPWTFAQCEAVLLQDNFAAFGLWRDDRLLTYISFYHFDYEMEILNLAVHPFARRRGLGWNTLLMLLQEGRKMGMHKVALEVRERNQAAIGLYEKAGFYVTGVRKKYYSDTGENALIYNYELL